MAIDEKQFKSVLKEIKKETKPQQFFKPILLEDILQYQYNYVHCKISEDDLKEYWLQFKKCLHSDTLTFFYIGYKVVEDYYYALNCK